MLYEVLNLFYGARLKELKIRYKVAVGRFQADPTRNTSKCALDQRSRVGYYVVCINECMHE